LRHWPIAAGLLVSLVSVILGLRFFYLPFGAPVAVAFILQSRTDFESIATEFGKKGLKAQAPAAIMGKSGVKHEFAFALVPDTGNVQIVVDTELSIKEVDEMKVLKFYVKVFDVGPEKAIFCVSPKLSGRAAAMAKEYGITVIEDEVPKQLVPMAARAVEAALTKRNHK